jgi:hypothetical protein
MRPYSKNLQQKRAGNAAQAVGHLPYGKHKALSSKPRTTKNKKEEKS